MKRRYLLIIFALLSVCCCIAQTAEQADSLHLRGRELMGEGKFVEARSCISQALEIRKKLFGEVNEGYINSLNNFAQTYGGEHNYAKGLEVMEKVMALCAQLPQPHKNIGMFTTNIGRFYYLTGDTIKAAKAWEQAIPLVEKFGENYEFLLNSLALVYTDLNDRQGIDRIMALTEEHNQHELTKPCDEPKCMMERGKYYGTVGNHAMAKECYQKALSMSMDNATKMELYETYAQFLTFTMHDRVTGAEYQYQAAALRKDISGENGDYADAIYKAGLYYSFAITKECFQKSLMCYGVALPIFQRMNEAAKVAKCKQMEGNAHSGLHDYGKAKACYQEALSYYEANDKESRDYPKLIERLAVAEKFNKEYDASIQHYRQALTLYEQRGMMQEYADAENGLKLCYAYASKDMSQASDGSHTDAIKAARMERLDRLIAETKEGLQLTRDYLGMLEYARSLGIIAGCYFMKESYGDAVDYYKQYMESVRDAIREEFRLQSEPERMLTWDKESDSMKKIKELMVDLPENSQSLAGDVAALAYDAELLSKGILLNSSIEFEKLLNEKHDAHLSDIYKKTKDNRAEMERLRKEAKTDADLERILLLSQENQSLQMQLNKECKEMEDFTHYISYGWKDVQAALSNQDVCIEFAAVDMGLSMNSSNMVALVLTKDMPKPVAVTIWNEDNLYNCCETDFYKALQDSLIVAGIKGKKPQSVLLEMKGRLDAVSHTFRPELSLYLNYLEHKADTTKGKFVVDLLFMMGYPKLIHQEDVLFDGPDAGDIVWGRLSSYLSGKRRIFFSADGVFNNIGIEYLSYNGKPLSEQFEVYRLSSTKELCYHHVKVKPTKAALFGDINYNDASTSSDVTQRALASLRGSDAGFADLGNTLREINDIQTILKQYGVKDAERFRNTEASKEAFMGLSDSKINLLHVATHGMYKDEKKSSDAESMSNSLLVFAGANIDDDALLSAADIADMNLRQCDLAVLSACETGLGRLGDDGVFGLQRGFKNAGVHTLLMSLRNVYDASTADLMINFYQHLMEGSSKREALVKAQQDIREKGFKDAKYWAAFILLDGLD